MRFLRWLKHIGSRRLSIGFIVICFIVLMIYLFASGEAAQLPHAFSWPRSLWLLLGAGSMVAGWFFEGWVLYEMGRGLEHPIPYKAAVRSTMVVQFFNNITPSSSGGQPMQIWSLWRDGVPVGRASSVLLGKFAVYQAALVTCGMLGVFYANDLFAQQIGGWVWLVVFGFVVQAAICAFLVAMIVKPTAVRRLVHFIARLLSRTKAHTFVDRHIVQVDTELVRFETEALALAGRPSLFIRTYLLTLVQLQSVLIVPYCICRAVGGVPNLLMALSAAAATLIVSSSFPTPGASGGAEGTFALIFSLLLPAQSPVGIAVLLWRLLTFYFPLFAGMPFCIGAPKQENAQVAETVVTARAAVDAAVTKDASEKNG